MTKARRDTQELLRKVLKGSKELHEMENEIKWLIREILRSLSVSECARFQGGKPAFEFELSRLSFFKLQILTPI